MADEQNTGGARARQGRPAGATGPHGDPVDTSGHGDAAELTSAVDDRDAVLAALRPPPDPLLEAVAQLRWTGPAPGRSLGAQVSAALLSGDDLDKLAVELACAHRNSDDGTLGGIWHVCQVGSDDVVELAAQMGDAHGDHLPPDAADTLAQAAAGFSLTVVRAGDANPHLGVALAGMTVAADTVAVIAHSQVWARPPDSTSGWLLGPDGRADADTVTVATADGRVSQQTVMHHAGRPAGDPHLAWRHRVDLVEPHPPLGRVADLCLRGLGLPVTSDTPLSAAACAWLDEATRHVQITGTVPHVLMAARPDLWARWVLPYLLSADRPMTADMLDHAHTQACDAAAALDDGGLRRLTDDPERLTMLWYRTALRPVLAASGHITLGDAAAEWFGASGTLRVGSGLATMPAQVTSSPLLTDATYGAACRQLLADTDGH